MKGSFLVTQYSSHDAEEFVALQRGIFCPLLCIGSSPVSKRVREMVAAFDDEAKKILLKEYPDGTMSFQVVGNVIWGVPKRP